tara:strand:+ start:447 stop:1106 length:660 start_codon:yes stop_codon:yes gene_type:complete
MIKNIIFDFDGVIVDSEILAAEAFSRYMATNGYNLKSSDFFKFAGKKTIEVISELSKEYDIKNEKKFYRDIMILVDKIYSEELSLVRGAYEFITNSNKKLFIGSNSMKNRILSGLKKVKLDKYFYEKNIVSFDMVERPKPYPDVYLEVVKRYKLEKEETIIIEDSSVGTQAGFASGIKVIGLTAGGHWHEGRSSKELIISGATTIIDDYKDLNEIIANL